MAIISDLATRRPSELMRHFRTGAAYTRAELADLTGWARATITARLAELESLGLIRHLDEQSGRTGRPSTRYQLAETGSIILTAELSPYELTVALVDLTGQVLAVDSERTPIADDPERALRWIEAHAAPLLERIGRAKKDLLLCVIGLPAPIEKRDGLPTVSSTVPRWHDIEVGRWVESRLGVSTIIDNLTGLQALGERTSGWPAVDDLLFIRIGTGIGAGIISDGSLQRGSSGLAGDIAHVKVLSPDDPAAVLCRCGGRGCLETVAGAQAIIAEVRSEGADVETLQDLVERLTLRDPRASGPLNRAGKAVGRVLATSASLINPAVIVVGGPLVDANGSLLSGIRETLYADCSTAAAHELQVLPARAGIRAGITGGAMLALDHIYSHAFIDDLVSRSVAEHSA